jgi:hypothetical protein
MVARQLPADSFHGIFPIVVIQVTNGRSATYAASPKKAYTFKVAAATLKGLGPYSPVMDIQPDPIGKYMLGCMAVTMNE